MATFIPQLFPFLVYCDICNHRLVGWGLSLLLVVISRADNLLGLLELSVMTVVYQVNDSQSHAAPHLILWFFDNEGHETRRADI